LLKALIWFSFVVVEDRRVDPSVVDRQQSQREEVCGTETPAASLCLRATSV
jgi:hypothetical protein